MADCPECYKLIVLGSADHDDVLTPHLFFSALSERVIHYLRCWNFSKKDSLLSKKRKLGFIPTLDVSLKSLCTRVSFFFVPVLLLLRWNGRSLYRRVETQGKNLVLSALYVQIGEKVLTLNTLNGASHTHSLAQNQCAAEFLFQQRTIAQLALCWSSFHQV